MNNQIMILRKLAWEFSWFANSQRNHENIKLHTAVNDLKQIRPVVLIDEIPWSEMNIDNELTLQCTDPVLREAEWFFRSNLYKCRHFPADMVLPDFLPVPKVLHSTGIGIAVDEEVLPTDENNNIVSHMFNDILQSEEDLLKIHNPVISYDREQTLKHFNLLGEVLGDILPVRIIGANMFQLGPWDDIARYRGVTNLLVDLADRPEFMHKIVRRLTDAKMSEVDQFEALGLFDSNPEPLHCTPVHTEALPQKDFDGGKMTARDIWGRGYAQIFAHVSKAMHKEFDIDYIKEVLGRFGLVYYGCCEPLDKKIDIVEEIPNLRKISITPWADVNIAAEAINKKYVLSAKPNPSSVAVPDLDEDGVRKELSAILNACKKNNCACDIVLKDISTCNKKPQNIFKWEKIAMELVRSY